MAGAHSVYSSLGRSSAALAARRRFWEGRAAQALQLRTGLGDAMDPVISRSADLDNLDSLMPGLLEVRAFLAHALHGVARPKPDYVRGSAALRVDRLLKAWADADSALARALVAADDRDEAEWNRCRSRAIARIVTMERLASRLLRQLGGLSGAGLERSA